MKQNINRRHWLKSSALLAGTFLIGNQVHAEYTGEVIPTSRLKNTAVPKLDFSNMKARLTSNENPFGPSKHAIEAMQAAISDSWMYAKLDKDALVEELTSMWGVTEDHIMIGAGSTELLMAAASQYGAKGNKILAADLTYMSLIRRACDDYNAELVTVPLTQDYQYDFDGLQDATTTDTTLVYICNPNNPTGVKADAAALKNFAAAASAKAPVFIDEAYLDFQPDVKEQSAVELVKAGKNVIVAKTFSKVHALAGMRIGYCIAKPETIALLKKFGTNGNALSRPGAVGALTTLQDDEFMQYSRKMVGESKEMLYTTLAKNGYDYIPSDTNFVLFPIRMNGDRFVTEMMKRGVGLKSVTYRNQEFCRVSIGTPKDMEVFAGAFKQIS